VAGALSAEEVLLLLPVVCAAIGRADGTDLPAIRRSRCNQRPDTGDTVKDRLGEFVAQLAPDFGLGLEVKTRNGGNRFKLPNDDAFLHLASPYSDADRFARVIIAICAPPIPHLRSVSEILAAIAAVIR
jgi:hypothetical protein